MGHSAGLHSGDAGKQGTWVQELGGGGMGSDDESPASLSGKGEKGGQG